MPTFPLARLGHFRTELHACFTRRADALFELGDALLCAPAITSVAQLSLEPSHRRGWGSSYAALAHGGIDEDRLRDLLVGCLPDADPLVFAVDVTTWPRCDAECSPERGYYYHPSRHSAGQPIIAGLGPSSGSPSSALTGTPGPPRWMPAACTRWRTPTRPPPRRSVRCGRLPAGQAVPLFAFADPTTWPTPSARLVCQDDQYGTVTVQAWDGLHPKQQRHPGHGTRRPRPIVRGTILRVQVQRVPARTRPPKVLWLWWAGSGEFDLDLAWRAYIRRFDLEHTVRFAKQTLGWTIPRPRTPEQADRWTWLVLAGYTQLRLARAIAGDQRLPWERPRPQPRLSPLRVRRGFPRLLCALGSPASTPKLAGRSPGRPRGRCSGPAVRHPAIKKPAKRPRSRPPRTTRAT